MRHEVLFLPSGGGRPSVLCCCSSVMKLRVAWSGETPGRVKRGFDNAGTDQHYRIGRVRQTTQEGAREEPVIKPFQVSRPLLRGSDEQTDRIQDKPHQEQSAPHSLMPAKTPSASINISRQQYPRTSGYAR